MRVKMRTRYAGPAGVCEPGKVIDVSEAEATALVSGGYAEAVDKPAAVKPVETASVEAPEQATTRRGRPRRRS